MTTYADTVYSALLTADEPMSSRGLYEAHDTFENPEQVNKAIANLVKSGRAERAGTIKPSKGKTVRLYRALTPDEQAERAPSAPADLDQQLAEAIRERDTELTEAVIEPLAAAEPLIGEWPDALEERPMFPREWPAELQREPDDAAFGIGLKIESVRRFMSRDGSDPIINAMRRMQIGKPRIQGIETDIRRARELAATIGTAGPDVSSWLYELADKLENAA